MTILAPCCPWQSRVTQGLHAQPVTLWASAYLNAGQRSVGIAPPADRIAVADRLLTRDLRTVEGEPVPALVGDPPATVGERESRVLPGYRGHVGQHQLHGPAPGPGARHPGFR